MSETRKHGRRWFQYSLRSLLLVMFLVSLGMGWFVVRMKRAREQKAAVEEIEKSGGFVWYDYAVDESGNPLPAAPPGPAWLRDLLGGDFFATSYRVSFMPSAVTDTGLEHLKGLAQFQKLDLDLTRVTDAGLKHLKGLTQLQWLFLGCTKVTDAGLVHLKQQAQLQLLDLGATQVSDAGLENLKGLTQLQSLDLGGTRVTDAGLNDLKRLTQLKNLFLWRTTVTNEGVKRLQKALPNCIIHGGPDLPRIMETGAP